METNLALVSPKPLLGLTNSPNPRTLVPKQCFGLPILPRKPTGLPFASRPRSRTILSAFSTPNSRRRVSHHSDNNGGKRINGSSAELFASTSATTTSVGVTPQPNAPPPPSQFGSPLFWFGVGVGVSALFAFVSSRLQKYAMQQAFKTMMGQMGSQNNQFGNAGFSPGSPFGFPPQSTAGPDSSAGFPYQPPSTSGSYSSAGSAASSGPGQATSAPPAASQASVTVDVSARNVDTSEPVTVKDETEVKTEAKQPAFVDVSPEETFQKSPFENYSESSSPKSPEDVKFAEVVPNGAASNEATTSNEGAASDWSQSTGKRGSVMSVEALEKMMEDPTVQKMVFPHLPEEMRNPATFKWMLQNPVYRQQLQEMLDNMGGNAEWDNRMVDTLKNFDLNSPEVKQQFDQLGVTPEEVISKIMANPDVAMAFQNPRVQQAIMDCSQNPLSIAKYQNDKEVMDVFNKISQLFPGTMGPPGF